MRSTLTVVALLFAATFAHADITITGTSKVKYVPDTALLSVGVQAEAKTAAEAWKKSGDLMQKVFAKLKELGVPESDLQTVSVGVNPRYHHQKDQPAQLIGYTASYDLSIRVRKISDAGKVLEGAVTAGANQRVGISFESSQTEKLMDEARVASITEARRRAELYTKGAGCRLGLVKTISEGTHHPYRMQHFEMTPAMLRDQTLPIAVGEQTLSASVTVTWTLDNSVQP